MMFSSIEEWEAWRELHKPQVVQNDGDNGGFNWWDPYATGTMPYRSSDYYDTGGYTGYWQSADTGMYTGEWPMGSVRANGRLAFLHQKELVLNAHDTENFLDAMQIVR
jgi:hypothetical protein